VKNNLTFFIFGIIIISVLPGIVQFVRNWLGNRRASEAPVKRLE
jgi:membrane-associated protein